MTNLVVLGDYSDNQRGYDKANADGAVYVVSIDEQSYTAMYNVQEAIRATSECLGQTVAVGVVKDGIYLSMDLIDDIDDTGKNPFTYLDLNQAFDQAIDKRIHLEKLRSALDLALINLHKALPESAELNCVDHCIDCLDEYRK